MDHIWSEKLVRRYKDSRRGQRPRDTHKQIVCLYNKVEVETTHPVQACIYVFLLCTTLLLKLLVILQQLYFKELPNCIASGLSA